MNIVSFNVPYPPVFGGAIDVFYKLKSLSEEGVRIYLHTFEYGRGRPSELEKYCEKVFYYKRDRSFYKGLQLTPYIVASRKNKELIKNLNLSQAPVLFEGIHTTGPLRSKALKSEGNLLYYTHQCPHTEKYVLLIKDIAEKKGIQLNVILLDTKEKAQAAVCPFTTYSLYLKGEFITNEILTEKKFLEYVDRYNL